MALLLAVASALVLRATALSNPLVLHAAALSKSMPRQDPLQDDGNASVAYYPNTTVPVVANREDYTRGHKRMNLFAGSPPGNQPALFLDGQPPFDPSDTERSQEFFGEISPTDQIGLKCAPGPPIGFVFYNTMVPEMVAYLVDPSRADFQNVSVIIAPGGGNHLLAWEGEGINYAQWLNSLGISAFVLKYRVPENGMDLGVMDAQRAVIVVREHAKEYGLDPHRVGFIGSSAGAWIASKVAFDSKLSYEPTDDLDTRWSSQPDFLVLLYGGMVDTWYDPVELDRIPKTFFAYTIDDPCGNPEENKKFKAVVEKFGKQSTVQIVEYPDGRHAWGDCNFYPEHKKYACCHWRDLVKPFLFEKVLGVQ